MHRGRWPRRPRFLRRGGSADWRGRRHAAQTGNQLVVSRLALDALLAEHHWRLVVEYLSPGEDGLPLARHLVHQPLPRHFISSAATVRGLERATAAGVTLVS